VDENNGYGWMIFASIVLVVVGIYDILWGITALARDEFLVNQVLFANLTFWGWFYLILGIIGTAAGFAILAKQQWARWFGVTWAGINMIFIFMVIWVYPVWAILIIALDVLIIYGLVSYGGREGELAA
jgi:hypothetical protein